MNRRFILCYLAALISLGSGYVAQVSASSIEIAGEVEWKEGGPSWKPTSPPFENRRHAGILLGERLLQDYGIETLKDAVILACPRGGLVFAQAVIDVLREAGGSPDLDLVISRKILVPGTEDYGAGAVTEQGKAIYVEHVLASLNLDPQSEAMRASLAATQKEVQRRIEAYRQGREPLSLANRVVIIVDIIASGGTMAACVESVRARSTDPIQRILVATPVSSPRGKAAVIMLTHIPEEDFCSAVIATPPVGVKWNTDDCYQLDTNEFEQMTDQDVRAILQAFR